MARTVVNILEELESTSGKNARIDILEAARKNEVLKKVFIAAQDPYTVYYVSKFKMPEPLSSGPGNMMPGEEDVAMEAFVDMLRSDLASRKVTGNAAKEKVERAMARVDATHQKWFHRILLKNLRVGLQESSINKVWPGCVTSFSVALAATVKSEFTRGEGIKILDKVKYPVRVEPKLDGLRLIAVKKDGVVTFFTRNGTVLESMPRIRAALTNAKFDNIVLDGEGMAADWNESSSVMMSGRSVDSKSGKKEQKDDSNIFYNIFDAMNLDEWTKQESTATYDKRVSLVASVVDTVSSSCVRQVPHINAKDEEELKAFFSKCMNEGYEGVMLKTLDSYYEWDRSKNIRKLKPVVTYEGSVVGMYDGRDNTRNEGKFGGFFVLLPNKIITRVGGGFNDLLRAKIKLDGMTEWAGKVVECEAQPDPMTPDGLTVDGKMRFPVYTRTRDEADVDKSIPATYTWWMKLTAEDRKARIDAVSRVKEDK
jgi:DNA ligase-1